MYLRTEYVLLYFIEGSGQQRKEASVAHFCLYLGLHHSPLSSVRGGILHTPMYPVHAPPCLPFTLLFSSHLLFSPLSISHVTRLLASFHVTRSGLYMCSTEMAQPKPTKAANPVSLSIYGLSTLIDVASRRAG